jgi:hypothetical protein
MNRQMKIIFLANFIFICVYFFFNWLEYTTLSTLRHSVGISANFPWYVYYYMRLGEDVSGLGVTVDYNFPLLIFLLALIVNMYLVHRFYGSKQTE